MRLYHALHVCSLHSRPISRPLQQESEPVAIVGHTCVMWAPALETYDWGRTTDGWPGPWVHFQKNHIGMWGSADGGAPEVTLETSMGSFTVELYYKHAPRTCRNFLELSRRGYYDNVKFHRIIKDFIVQGGDPTGTGRGGESIYGSKFEDEIKPELKHTGAGILSMANAGPNSNGSQFFITLAPAQSLDGKVGPFYHRETG
ncbi:Peptidyl-prolyl cis-trans isomerase CYP18-2 [Vitis vinifera]|uniref:Peptidyl-prolyl cis-trans isomerase n=1 Tax=Vitis vinifera TaxID=29760 RepID=A0A438JRZ3_VITVI|nr:Peptidyl-prolyl cis-trans isomerase CYP18-2 [Vitis vinifera]